MRRVGVEEELLLLSARDGHPMAAFDEVQAEAMRRHGQGAEH